MQIKASLKNYRKPAQKVREVSQLLPGMKVEEAVHQLMAWRKEACQDLLSLLKSAVANAQNNFKVKEEDLYIKEVKVNEGATLKRIRARAHGSAARIFKRTCHIDLILDKSKSDKKAEELSKKTKITEKTKKQEKDSKEQKKTKKS